MTEATETLRALREAFDRGFAEPAIADETAREEMVVVRVGPERLAFRLAALAGIERLERVVPLPGGPPAFVGLCGLRGRIVPVFGLAALVGVAAEPRSGWIAVVGREDPIALAFDALEGVSEVESAAIVAAEAHRAGEIVPESVRIGPALVGVVRVPAVIAALTPGSEED